MAIKKVLQVKETGGDFEEESVLRGENLPVENLTDEIKTVINDLRDTMWEYPFCIGLSAPQIGYNYQISIFNLKRENKEEDIVMINPRIISLSGKKDKKRESCMSVWGLMGEVERRDKLTVEYYDVRMEKKELSVTGFESRVIQHELDHLQGIVYIDKLSNPELLKADFFDNYINK